VFLQGFSCWGLQGQRKPGPRQPYNGLQLQHLGYCIFEASCGLDLCPASTLAITVIKGAFQCVT
jgi:hypothetical protein